MTELNEIVTQSGVNYQETTISGYDWYVMYIWWKCYSMYTQTV